MSKSKFIGDIVHTEKYSDRQTGEEKKKHTRAGALFQRDDGSFSVKMFDSWFNVYPPKSEQQKAPAPHSNNDDLGDTEIPF